MSVLQNNSISAAAKPTVLSDKAQWAATICGCIVAFAYSANYTNHAPLAPALMHRFGFNQALGGYIVDRFGAKRVLLFALAIVAIGNLGMASAGAYWQLLFFKVFTGMG